jgi:hypothetical protein
VEDDAAVGTMKQLLSSDKCSYRSFLEYDATQQFLIYQTRRRHIPEYRELKCALARATLTLPEEGVTHLTRFTD